MARKLCLTLTPSSCSAHRLEHRTIETAAPRRGPVYLRYYRNSAPRDYVLPGTRVKAYYKQKGYVCVSGRTASGQKKTGWIWSKSLPKSARLQLGSTGTKCINRTFHCDDNPLSPQCKWKSKFFDVPAHSGNSTDCNGNDDWPCFTHLQCRVRKDIPLVCLGGDRAGQACQHSSECPNGRCRRTVPVLYRPIPDLSGARRMNCEGGPRHGQQCWADDDCDPSAGGDCQRTIAMQRSRICTSGTEKNLKCKNDIDCPGATEPHPCRKIYRASIFLRACQPVGLATNFFGHPSQTPKEFGRRWAFRRGSPGPYDARIVTVRVIPWQPASRRPPTHMQEVPGSSPGATTHKLKGLDRAGLSEHHGVYRKCVPYRSPGALLVG
jgi:hypothetical protein